MATATLIPSGIEREFVTRNEEWVESERGGLASLTFECDLDASERAELVYGTPIVLPVPNRAPLLARVIDAGPGVITCGGGQSLLDDFLGGATYSISKLEPWGERTADDRATNIGISIEASQWRAVWEKGTAYTAGWNGAFVVLSAPTSACRIVIPYWSRPSNVNTRYSIFSGVRGGGTESEPWTWTSRYVQPVGAAEAITGTQTLDITGTNIEAILIQWTTVNPFTPTSAVSGIIRSPRVYGTSLTTVTPTTVAADILSRVGVTNTSLATITTDLTDIDCNRDETLSSLATDLLDRGDWLLRIEPRPASTGYEQCGVLEARPATADEVLTCDGRTVIADIQSASAGVTDVTVGYRSVSGDDLFVAVPAGGSGAAVVRWETIDVDTTSLATATAWGTEYLALKTSGVRGTVRVEGRCDFTPGHRLTFENTSMGTVTARVTQINATKTGCTLTLDDTDSYEDWVKRGGVSVRAAAVTKKVNRRVLAMQRRKRGR